MAKNPKQTTPPAAKVASKQLRSESTTPAAKTTAASALSQAAPTSKPKKR